MSNKKIFHQRKRAWKPTNARMAFCPSRYLPFEPSRSFASLVVAAGGPCRSELLFPQRFEDAAQLAVPKATFLTERSRRGGPWSQIRMLLIWDDSHGWSQQNTITFFVADRFRKVPNVSHQPGRCSYYCAAIIPRSCNMTSFTCEWPFSANPSDAPAKKNPAIKSEKYTKAMDYNPYKDEGCGFLYGWHKVATYFQVSASPPCSQWRCVFYVIARFFWKTKNHPEVTWLPFFHSALVVLMFSFVGLGWYWWDAYTLQS